MKISSPGFLDTSVLVDLILKEAEPSDLAKLESVLAQFDSTLGCAFSRLEFKRVVLRNLSLCLDYLREEGSFFKALLRANRIRGRRSSTLISILCWIEFNIDREIEVESGEGVDAALAEEAELFVDNAIEWIWERFDTLVDKVVDRMKCNRAAEAPVRSRTNRLDVTVHENRCKDRKCNNANFIRSLLPKAKSLLTSLEKYKGTDDWTDELEKSHQMLSRAVKHPDVVFDYQNCLKVGDVWIHFECLKAGAQKFVTANYRESKVLCSLLELEMVNPRE